MNTENTNDFSKCKIGDKLWSMYAAIDLQSEHNCAVDEIHENCIKVRQLIGSRIIIHFFKECQNKQTLFFSRPQIIAPPEPPRLPDYKPGQWIAVWDDGLSIVLRKFARFNKDIVLCNLLNDIGVISWQHHCTLEQLPEVLAKWGEGK